MFGQPSTLIAAALGDELSENEASIRVFMTAGGLAILGLALLLFTLWWWRGTRPEPPALGPLEVMGDRRWNTATDAERRRMIDQHRPDGSFELLGVVAPIPIDLSVLARDLPSGFDDLREPVLALGPVDDAVAIETLGESSTADASDGDAPSIIDEIELNGVQAEPVGVGPIQPDVDATMYQVEAPSNAAVAAAIGSSQRLEEPSDEPAIDPLLQRSAAQD